MRFWIRLKFLVGLLAVIIVVGMLVLYLNNAMSTVHASKAELGADTSTVGVDYPGVISKQNVAEGDKVSKGQTLFTVNSPQLAADVANRTVQTANLPFSFDTASSNILVKANDNGVMEKIYLPAGSYVTAGTALGTIDTADSLYISAHLHLTPPDYARVRKGSTIDVTFPDNTHGTAKVYSIALANDGGIVDTIVKGRLTDGNVDNFRFPVGTPVEASLKLTNRTWYQQLIDGGRQLFKPSAQ